MVNPSSGSQVTTTELSDFAASHGNDPDALATSSKVSEAELGSPPEMGTKATAPDPQRLSTPRVVLLASIMMVTYFIGTASGQAAILNIPRIAIDLDISELTAQWVVSAYSLAYGCGLLFSGRLCDRHGGKVGYTLGLAIFCFFSVLAGLMKSGAPLFVMRGLSGLGLALAGPAGYNIVGKSIKHEPERTIVFAAFGLGSPIGAATGTLLGGAVAGISSPRAWSYLFYILAGIGAIPFLVGLLIIPNDFRWRQNDPSMRLDYFGGFLVTAAMSLFMFSLSQSGVINGGWRVPYIPALLATSIVLFGAFLAWERYLEYYTSFPPCVKFSMFTRHRGRISAVLACAMLILMSVVGFVFVGTIWYQNFKGQSALENAILLLPCNVMGVGAAASTMYLTSRVKAPLLIIIGCFLSGVTSLLYAVVPASTNYWACEFIAQLFLPWGIDFTVCVGNVLVMKLVEADEQGVGGALFQTSYCLGSALATCISSLVINDRQAISGSLLTALRDACWMNTAIAWAIVPIAFFGLRGIGLAEQARETVVLSINKN